MKQEEMRREFNYLIDSCGCSKASVFITPKEAKELNVDPVTPSCTPKTCFPNLYNLSYPKGGFNKKSHTLKRALIRMKKKAIK